MTAVRNFSYAVLAAFAVLYAATSIEYFSNFDAKPLTLWDQLFALVTATDFANEAGSVRVEMHSIYSANRIALQVHATTGALMLVLGLFQFSTALRRRRPGLHRALGKTYVVLAIPTSGGALIYLASVPPDSVYSGAVFFVALLGLALATGFSTYMAYHTARRRQFRAHRAWMLQSYFYILSAPILRLIWVVLYQISPGMTQWDNNLYAVAPATALIAFGPLTMWLLYQEERR